MVKFCKLMKECVVFVKDMMVEGVYFFNVLMFYDEIIVFKKWKEDFKELMKKWNIDLSNVEFFIVLEIEVVFKLFLEEYKLGIGVVFLLFRLLVIGVGMGLLMFEIVEFLGKEECVK